MSEKIRHIAIAAIASIVLTATTVGAAAGPVGQIEAPASAARA